MAAQYAPRSMQGNVVVKTEIVNNAGQIVKVTIEEYNMGNEYIGINTQGVGAAMYMFEVNGKTNYKLYQTVRKAINAAAKI